ncbi:MAG: GNAT family N-acetyltransferase [Alphaproteobacteria bacterium]
MRSLTILWLAFVAPLVVFASFDGADWDAYRLKNPEKSFQPFTTDRLTAKPATAENFEALFEAGKTVFSQPQVLEYWAGSRTDTPETTERWRVFLGRAQKRCEANLLSWRGCYLTAEPETFVGFVGAHRYQDAGNPYDGTVEAAVVFDSNHWKKGYAMESLQGFAKNDLMRLENYQYIFIPTHAANENSLKLGQKFGTKPWILDLTDPLVPSHLKRENRTFWRVEKEAIVKTFGN